MTYTKKWPRTTWLQRLEYIVSISSYITFYLESELETPNALINLWYSICGFLFVSVCNHSNGIKCCGRQSANWTALRRHLMHNFSVLSDIYMQFYFIADVSCYPNTGETHQRIALTYARRCQIPWNTLVILDAFIF